MNNKLKDEKTLLRSRYRELRNSINKVEKVEFDDLIFQRIISHELYKECKIVLAYYSINSEVDTLKLINYTLSIGKSVALPRCNGDRTISFYIVNSLDSLEISSYGIAEPIENLDTLVHSFDSSLCIVPALAYDMKGFRLGYGGGYYDKFLSSHRNIITMGICYSACLTDSLINEEHDISIDYLMTEKDFVEVYDG